MSNPTAPQVANPAESVKNPKHHVCPWWVGYLLASPIRRMIENPDKLLSPHVRPGMTVLDIGCAMGFFSLPLARMVGPDGRVVGVDVQARMLRALERRARRKGLSNILETRPCTQEKLGLEDLRGSADLALVFHVVHESLYPARVLAECLETLKPGGRLLLAEPMAHTTQARRDEIFALAERTGFVKTLDLSLRKSQAAVYEKPDGGSPVGA